MAGKGVMPDPASSVQAIGIEYRRAEAALIARLAGLQLVGIDRTAQISAVSIQPACIEKLSEELK